MYQELNGKVVMITGAAGALGQDVVRYFDEAGSKLALLEHRMARFEEAFGEELKASWLLLETDVTSQDDVKEAVQKTVATYGTIDVLINIAGGYAGGKNIVQTEEKTWDFMMNLNAKSVFLLSGAVIAVLQSQSKGGRIISIGARPGLQGTNNHSAYSASKSAVLRLTESMAAEFRHEGITANAVLPSMIDTPANRKSMPNGEFEKWVQPRSIAGVLGFLASEAAQDISGALIPIYGGMG